jgi:DNA recombination protein RmuC
MQTVLWFVAGAITSWVLIWLAGRGRSEQLANTLADARAREEEAKAALKQSAAELRTALDEKVRFRAEAVHLADVRQELAEARAKQNELQDSLAQVNKENSAIKERLTAQASQHDEHRKAMLAEFEKTAQEVLRNSGQSFLNLAAEKLRTQNEKAAGELDTKKAEINGLIEPMKTALVALDENVRSLRQSEASLLKETRELATALKDSKRRGNWGELQLRRIAELAGMTERCDFTVQDLVLTNENRRLYPDMTVRLPNHRVVIVDSKASMTAYAEAANAVEPAQQSSKLAEHAKAVRKRVEELSSKEYRTHVSGSADFVVCFIPGEAFFGAAIAADADLLEYAAEKNVILASPTTLLSLLRAIALGWKEAKLAEDAKEICKLGVELYERLRTSTSYVIEMGDGLNSAVAAYDSFIGSMERRVFPQARRFKALVGSDKPLPEPKSPDKKTRKPVAEDWTGTSMLLEGIAATTETDVQELEEPATEPV